MTKNDAEKLAEKIATTTCTCVVTGYRHYGKGSYSLDVTDKVTGYPFVVHSVADWDERLRLTR